MNHPGGKPAVPGRSTGVLPAARPLPVYYRFFLRREPVPPGPTRSIDMFTDLAILPPSWLPGGNPGFSSGFPCRHPGFCYISVIWI